MQHPRQPLATAVALALLLAPLAVAHAQVRQDTTLLDHTRRPPQAAKELGKVTVTAQSRTQEMQDVPIAMDFVTLRDRPGHGVAIGAGHAPRLHHRAAHVRGGVACEVLKVQLAQL